MSPEISIVTATLNRREMLSRAIASAMAQGLDGVEHIVIDGASTDGTLELLAGFPHLRVVSEPDRNLYEGWNKGIRLATGTLICILNSDDELPDGAFDIVRGLLRGAPAVDMISGAVEIVRNGGPPAGTIHVLDHPAMIALREQDIGPGVPLTNGRFLSRQLLDRVGPFDERYSAISDRQFFLRAQLARRSHVTTDKPLYRYHIHDGSLTLNDRTPSLAHARQCLAAARDGMAEAEDPVLRAAYRRWHAWASFYLAGLEARGGQVGQSFGTAVAATGRDPFWPFRLPPMLARHLNERAARLGRPVA